jgi:hypothetical protein
MAAMRTTAGVPSPGSYRRRSRAGRRPGVDLGEQADDEQRERDQEDEGQGGLAEAGAQAAPKTSRVCRAREAIWGMEGLL